MTQAQATSASVTIRLHYLPDNVLSKNGRGLWPARHREFQQVKRDAYLLLREQVGYDVQPADRLVMDIHWRQAVGRTADDDNIITRMAAARDAAAMAGLVWDDSDIRVGAAMIERVAKGEECVVVTFRRNDAL